MLKAPIVKERNSTLGIRVNEEEIQQLDALASHYGYRSRSEFARKVIFTRRNILLAKQLIRKSKQE